ncbi:hypothetical protein V1477_011870 [Vespula maculifrons]|uniref:Uncharacterized protein n=1 Tax=Vespula maculifrons TaxID=7453 RepID=A0ABD2C0F2_VESMC
MTINIRCLFTSVMTIRTLESWFLTAFILQVSSQTRLLTERTWTVWTWKLFASTIRTIVIGLYVLGMFQNKNENKNKNE